MKRLVWLFVLLLTLAGCAVQAPAPLPALVSVVPTDSFERADLPCYYGPVW
jgi:hypothetical protein